VAVSAQRGCTYTVAEYGCIVRDIEGSTHEEQVVARQHAVLLGEGRELVGCATLEFLLDEVTNQVVSVKHTQSIMC
jgi:hypothetical protein